MSAQVLMVDLKDDPAIVASYLEHHQTVWPDVRRSLQAAGVRTMDIYILDRRLVMIVDTGAQDLRECLAAHAGSGPRIAQWEALMRSLQEPSPGAPAGEWWTAMQPVFHLDGIADLAARREPAQRG
ncbi:MAG: L-rhamnose mutarotase [Vicinamibacterales bacterium]